MMKLPAAACAKAYAERRPLEEKTSKTLLRRILDKLFGSHADKRREREDEQDAML